MNIKCASCSCRYDYLVDESCPQCGAYNSPPDGRTHSCSTYELDHPDAKRHRSAPKKQTFTRPTITPTNTVAKRGFETNQQRATRLENTPRRWNNKEGEHPRKRMGGIIVLIILAVYLLGNVIGGIANYINTNTVMRPDTKPSAPVPVYDTSDLLVYEPNEVIPLDYTGLTVAFNEWENLGPVHPYYDDVEYTILAIPTTISVADTGRNMDAIPPDIILYYGEVLVSVYPIDHYWEEEISYAWGIESMDLFDILYDDMAEEYEGYFYFCVPTADLEYISLVVIEAGRYLGSDDFYQMATHYVYYEQTALPKMIGYDL